MITISILTYNKLEYTKLCLNSLQTNTVFPVRFVISDNGSTDGTVEYLQTLNWIIFKNNRSNLGFARAHNKIMKLYPEDDIVLLNNDTELPYNWLRPIREAITLENLGAAAPAIRTPSGLDVGGKIDKNGNGHSIIDNDTEPDWITGSCFYITRKTINIIGGLDETFRFYYEDVDYCFRMKEAGIKFKCIRNVVITHFNSISSDPGLKKIWLQESKSYFVKKHTKI